MASISAQRPITARTERGFYLCMMAVISAALLLGFAQSVFLRPWFPDVKTAPEPYFYFHGLVMFAWMALFTMQVVLVAARRPATHRTLGIAGVAMVPVMGAVLLPVFDP